MTEADRQGIDPLVKLVFSDTVRHDFDEDAAFWAGLLARRDRRNVLLLIAALHLSYVGCSGSLHVPARSSLASKR